MSDPDYSLMTDSELADALYEALEEWGKMQEDYEAVIFAENEVCDRLDLSLDETAQGLTAEATRKVDMWVERHRRKAVR